MFSRLPSHPAPRHPRGGGPIRVVILLAALAAGAGLWLGAPRLFAQEEPAQGAPVASPLHPTFALLDGEGKNVLTSGAAVSTMRTCGSCHDTEFIESHSFHANLGLDDFGQDGLSLAQSWDSSTGLFGKWDALTNRYLSPPNTERMDLSTPEWLMLLGRRVPGGGPTITSRTGEALTSLAADAGNPESAILAADGSVQAWDWQQSGTMEMDCFLCHLSQPDAVARAEELAAGRFGWANTATLQATGIVTRSIAGFIWQPQAFDDDGDLKPEFVQIQDPTNENCATCHGVVHTDTDQPLLLDACDPANPQTMTTGQVIASQQVVDSGLNLSDKNTLTRAWDIHAERAVKCTDCHYALNNPVHAQEAAGTSPSHLLYDPRRLELGEYLEQPDHNFARGESAQFTVDADRKGSMRRCESCHAAQENHADWLPYTERHLEVLACESCHIPSLSAPALQSVDWTVVHADGSAVTSCRGVEGDDTVTGLVTGYQPVLMQRTNVDGDTMLAPYNLISSWYWVYDDGAGQSFPVRQVDLRAAYLQGDGYAPEILAAFDLDSDGALSDDELVIDSEAKQTLVAGRLADLGLGNPRIQAQVQPYSINHNVVRDEWATSSCHDCHARDSQIAAALELSNRTPGGVIPTFVNDTNVAASGIIQAGSEGGALRYQPQPEADGIYIFGRDRVAWVDWLGALAFVGTLLAVLAHGALRFVAAMRRPHHAPALKRVYMYQAYERFWHWLQTATIILLLFTGLVIHRPDMFGIFSFPHMVTVHNILAAILLVNAGLSLFWHLAGGGIKKFIPRPYGFFDQAILQTKFYLAGIFRNEAHPFEKTRERHLNPLQQITYFGILNVLLPLQVITGALMWGAQQWPRYANALGGLPLLAPFHSLVAWLFATFIVGHVYLTTTGHEPLGGIRAMITGWDEVEVSAGTVAAQPVAAKEAQPGLAPSPNL